uniref:Helicase ATP-binding domain-containing protein n=1 Tax=Meloidogyne incognita TaxID=6306 RepID=A0A914NQT6_MELIC
MKAFLCSSPLQIDSDDNDIIVDYEEADSDRKCVVLSDDECKVNSNGNFPSTSLKKNSVNSLVCESKTKKKADIICIDDDDLLKLSDDDDLAEYTGDKHNIPLVRLAQETLDAEKSERERRKRLEESKSVFNGIELNTDDSGCSTFECTDEHGNPTLKSVMLDRDSESQTPIPVRVHPFLVKVLKKHQAEGIQFLYNCTIESLSRLDEPGGGAILGHCMGLGKTLQIIAFLHTILTHEKISKKINKVLVVVPKNVVLNWMNEFEKWLYGETDSINYLELDSWKTHEERLKTIKRWINYERPAVLIIGYELFRILTFTDEDKANMNRNKRKNIPLKRKLLTSNEEKLANLRPQFCEYLQNAPHLIVCDEGHKLKSPSTGLFHTINRIKTKRRICMTGTPLQNNLEEYYCMVNFVKPNLLGSLDEFKSRFSNIIKCGRAKDASAYDVRRMRRRCHVLFDRLKCVLDWRDYSVLRNSLPPKQEYVINIRLTKVQIDLYKKYLDFRNLIEERRCASGEVGIRLLYDHLILYRVWTHPYLLVEKMKLEQK